MFQSITFFKEKLQMVFTSWDNKLLWEESITWNFFSWWLWVWCVVVIPCEGITVINNKIVIYFDGFTNSKIIQLKGINLLFFLATFLDYHWYCFVLIDLMNHYLFIVNEVKKDEASY